MNTAREADLEQNPITVMSKLQLRLPHVLEKCLYTIPFKHIKRKFCMFKLSTKTCSLDSLTRLSFRKLILHHSAFRWDALISICCVLRSGLLG